MKLFVQSQLCRSGTFCGICRDREGGRAMRAKLAAAYELPQDAPDFVCPYGKPWGSIDPAPVKTSGPGTELSRMFARFKIQPEPGCDCLKLARQMDDWGPDGCEANMTTILDRLAAEAKRRGLPFSRIGGKLLVLLAIRRARRAQRKGPQPG